VGEEALLPLDDRLRDALDRVEALQDVLDEPARLLQPRVEDRRRAVQGPAPRPPRWPRIALAYRSLMRSSA
jgi:hypothetical protein